jgi:tRNA dimethylallyltransferase
MTAPSAGVRAGQGSDARPAMPPLVVIAGATATGKTRLSLRLATELGGVEIISADSRQVYRGMDIGTAKVSAHERSLVPHHGLDLVDPDETFSVSLYQRHALNALAGIAARGRVALLVGGTGLYLRAVARGVPLAEAPHDPELRARLEADLAAYGAVALAERLRREAPVIASRTDLANPRRVVRALERALVDGDRLPPEPLGYPGDVLWLGLQVDHVTHRQWIANRAAGQYAGGLLHEAASLAARYDPALPALSAIGYREAIEVTQGRRTAADALAETIVRTRAYARRQRTWFRAEPGVQWIDATRDPYPVALGIVRRFLRGTGAR